MPETLPPSETQRTTQSMADATWPQAAGDARWQVAHPSVPFVLEVWAPDAAMAVSRFNATCGITFVHDTYMKHNVSRIEE